MSLSYMLLHPTDVKTEGQLFVWNQIADERDKCGTQVAPDHLSVLPLVGSDTAKEKKLMGREMTPAVRGIQRKHGDTILSLKSKRI